MMTELTIDIVERLRSEIEQLRSEIEQLRAERIEFDCRFTMMGEIADISGMHCPVGKPCMRCEIDRLRVLVNRCGLYW